MRQYAWVWLIAGLVMLTPLAVLLIVRGGDAGKGLGVGFMMGAGLAMLDRELSARRAIGNKPAKKPE
jgi:hypothetical protein